MLATHPDTNDAMANPPQLKVRIVAFIRARSRSGVTAVR